MSYTLQNPFMTFINPVNGKAVGGGLLYVGLPDTDPQSNPLDIYAVQPDGSEILLSQPITLLTGGVPSFNGSPVQLKIDAETVSIKVTNSSGAQVYYTARWDVPSKGMLPDTFVAELAAANTDVFIAGFQAKQLRKVDGLKNLIALPNVTMSVSGFYEGSSVGGGDFYYDPLISKTTHNGITHIDPDKLAAWDGTRADLSTLFSASTTGSGVFVRLFVDKRIFVTWAGADPTGGVGSYTPLQHAINVAKEGWNLVVDGYFRCGGTLNVDKTMTLSGFESRASNVPDVNLTSSTIYFDSGSAVGVNIQGVIVTIDGVIIVGTGIGDGVRSSGDNNSLILTGGSVVQGFEVGVRLTEGYYNKLDGSTITFCRFPVQIDYCYNVTMSQITIRASGSNTQGITLTNGSQLTMIGGSIENCTIFGVGVYGGASLVMNGVYFENEGGKNVQIDSNGLVTAIGCHVYLNTGASTFIGQDGDSNTGVRVFSRGNRLILPTDTTTSIVYEPNSEDDTSDWDIAGDRWQSDAGVNVTYVAGSYSNRVGRFSVVYPTTHPLKNAPINTVAYNPVASQPDSTAFSIEDLVSDFNSLLAKLRNAGVML